MTRNKSDYFLLFNNAHVCKLCSTPSETQILVDYHSKIPIHLEFKACTVIPAKCWKRSVCWFCVQHYFLLPMLTKNRSPPISTLKALRRDPIGRGARSSLTFVRHAYRWFNLAPKQNNDISGYSTDSSGDYSYNVR